MSFRRFALPLFVVAASVVAACSGDAGSVVGAPSSSGNGTSSSGASGTTQTSSSSSGTVDRADILTLTIGSDWCAKPPGQCLDAQSFTVDFVNSTVTNTTCVELASKPDAGPGGTQDGKTSHAITKDQLEKIQKLVEDLESTVYAGTDAGIYNNAKRTLQVTYKTGPRYFATSDTLCPNPPGTALKAGWTELWDAIRAM